MKDSNILPLIQIVGRFGTEVVDGFIKKFSITKCAKTSFTSIPLREVTRTTNGCAIIYRKTHEEHKKSHAFAMLPCWIQHQEPGLPYSLPIERNTVVASEVPGEINK